MIGIKNLTRLLASVAALLVLTPGSSSADSGELKLTLAVTKTDVRLTIANISKRSVTFNRRLSHGSEASPTEVRFDIRDAKGRALGLMNILDIKPANEFDWIVLHPKEFVGVDIRLSNIEEDYGVRLGKYTIKARYVASHNPAIEGSRSIQLESNSAVFVSNTDTLKEFCDETRGAETRRHLPWAVKYCR
jgi:hypothetical protein